MINIALCDDERSFLYMFEKKVKKTFGKYNFDVNIELFENGRELIEQIEKKNKYFDLIFLDIDMPMINGFVAAGKLKQLDNKFELVFTSRHKLHKEGYKYNAFRFIDKDTLDVDLPDVVNDFIRKRKMLSLDEEQVEFRYSFENGSNIVKVMKKDIIYLEVIKRQVWLFTIYGEYRMRTYSLQHYMDEINSNSFMIVSRKYGVNFAHIQGVQGEHFILSNRKTVCIGSTPENIQAVMLRYSQYRNERI